MPILFKKYGVDRIRPHLYIRAPLPLCGLGQNNATARLQRQAKCEKSWVATNEIFAVATNTAWTGNTPSSGAACRLRTVHPRVGGEHPAVDADFDAGDGSSPRGRGTRRDSGSNAAPPRFIPAWAGNTAGRAPASSSAAVHPRVGGEHSVPVPAGERVSGSSPRGWGTRAPAHGQDVDSRFIPAWAGNTTARCPGTARSPVHPRVGGEHWATCWGVQP